DHGACDDPDDTIVPIRHAGADSAARHTANRGTDRVAIAAADIDPERHRIGLRPNIVWVGLHNVDRVVIVRLVLVLVPPAMGWRPGRRIGQWCRWQSRRKEEAGDDGGRDDTHASAFAICSQHFRLNRRREALPQSFELRLRPRCAVPNSAPCSLFLRPAGFLVYAEPPALDTEAGRNIHGAPACWCQVKDQLLTLVGHVQLTSDKALTIPISCAVIAYDDLRNLG